MAGLIGRIFTGIEGSSGINGLPVAAFVDAQPWEIIDSSVFTRSFSAFERAERRIAGAGADAACHGAGTGMGSATGTGEIVAVTPIPSAVPNPAPAGNPNRGSSGAPSDSSHGADAVSSASSVSAISTRELIARIEAGIAETEADLQRARYRVARRMLLIADLIRAATPRATRKADGTPSDLERAVHARLGVHADRLPEYSACVRMLWPTYSSATCGKVTGAGIACGSVSIVYAADDADIERVTASVARGVHGGEEAGCAAESASPAGMDARDGGSAQAPSFSMSMPCSLYEMGADMLSRAIADAVERSIVELGLHDDGNGMDSRSGRASGSETETGMRVPRWLAPYSVRQAFARTMQSS